MEYSTVVKYLQSKLLKNKFQLWLKPEITLFDTAFNKHKRVS